MKPWFWNETLMVAVAVLALSGGARGQSSENVTLPPPVSSFELDPSAPHLGGLPLRPIFINPFMLICPVHIHRVKNSGPLVTMPQLVLAWWDKSSFWDQPAHLPEQNYYVSALEAFGDDDKNFWGRLSEYGVTGGSYLGAIDLGFFGILNLPVGGLGRGLEETLSAEFAILTEQDIQAFLASYFNISGKTPSQSTIYLVMLPDGVQDEYDLNQDGTRRLGGHHQLFFYKSKPVWYGVIEYHPDKTTTLSFITHEAYEAATDPDLCTGYWDPPFPGFKCVPGDGGGETEIGDPCNLMVEIIDGYPVQEVFSQKICGCK